MFVYIFSENQELKENETEWVKETTDQVYSLLRETPPDGEQFSKSIQNILKVNFCYFS